MPEIIGYKQHVTVEGDTFDDLSLLYYDDEQLASRIISANLDHCDVLIFDAGVTLRIPIMDSVDTPETLPPWRRNA